MKPGDQQGDVRWESPLFDLEAWNIRALPTPLFLYLRYFRQFGRIPFPGCERTFNDHILRLMARERDARRVVFGDKLKTRAYVSERLGPDVLPKIFQASRNPDGIDPDRLPESFVLKPSHSSGLVKIVFDKQTLDWAAARAQMKSWLNEDYSVKSREYIYRNPDPQVYAEELLLQQPGRLCFDHKLFCFHGEPKLIHVIVDRSPTNLRQRKHAFFDTAWRKIDMNWGMPISEGLPKPACLDRLLEIGRALSAGFDFLRVDAYVRGGDVIVGELTSFPDAGLVMMEPRERDAWLGSFFKAGA